MEHILQHDPYYAQGEDALPDMPSPWHLLFFDISLLLRFSTLIGLTLWPCFTNNPNDELFFWDWRNVVALFWQAFLFFYALVAFALLVCVLPFGVFAFTLAVMGITVDVVVRILKITPLMYTSKAGAVFEGESWLYVSGICCDRTWLKLNCERLVTMFGRRVIGIQNHTFGPVFDLLQCIIQRDFGYATDDVSVLYTITKQELCDARNTRVVLIAHSQGAIIASLVVDRLLASVSHRILGKLELYTFGSAANHMHGAGVLGKIEHFANQRDFFAQIGVLAYRSMRRDQYSGHVYVDWDATGHLLNMHYLHTTFLGCKSAIRSHMATYLIDNGKEKALDEVIPDSYTVILKDGHTLDSFRHMFDGLCRSLEDNSKINEEYGEIPVVNATLSQAMYDTLKSAPEVDNIMQAHVVKMATVEARPNPPSWGLSRISKRARDLRMPYFFPTQAGDGVTVYVIDSGVNITHRELNGSVVYSHTFVPGTNIHDSLGHGTQVAAIIGGHSCGVANRVAIVNLKVLNTKDGGIDTRVVAALRWVEQDVRPGRKVVNMSLEGPKSEEIDKQIERLFKNNIPSFVAAGNKPSKAASDGSPSGARYAYTVAATDRWDRPFRDNSFGGNVNIFAPGVNITSAAFYNVNQYKNDTGTSMAAPHVAGVAALCLSINPDMTAEEVLDTITRIATRKAIQGSLRGSPNFLVFNGVVDHQGGGPGWASRAILFLRRRMRNLIGS